MAGLVLNAVLLAAAWLGHAFTCTVILNVVYSQPLPTRVQRSFRLLVAFAVFGFPVAMLLWTGGAVWQPGPLRIYVGFCLAVAVLILPAITLYRRLRRPPKELVAESGRVVDIAKDLGYRPLGFGKHWELARLPANQLFEVEFTQKTLKLPRLPAAWDGLTVLHLSDLHFHGTPEREFFARVFDIAMTGGLPDLVCLTGDVVDTVAHQRWIKPLLGRLKWREAGLAILGNHDRWYGPDGVRKQLRRAGLKVLGNGWQTITVRGMSMTVIGHEGPWFRPAPCVKGVSEGDFRLLLSHTPDHFGWARAHGVNLMLSGHVHGGQVRVPVLGPLFVPSRYSRRYDSGVFVKGPTVLHVTRGLSGREPLRWNCRPEVSRLVLVAGQPKT